MMALADIKRLYDISVRLAIYTEGVKTYHARQFDATLREVDEELKKLLGRITYRTLDGLSKAQLNRLIVELRESQSQIYSRYTQTLLDQLKAFMAADLEVNRRVWVSAYKEKEDELEEEIGDKEATKFLLLHDKINQSPLYGVAAITGNNDRLWSQITNTPIPANGLYLLPFIKTFSSSAQAGVENIIRKAWANRLTVEETIKELIGATGQVQGTPSQLARIKQQATAVVHTATAHVAAITTAAVSSAVFSYYGWYSVMDSNTTEICTRRNLQRFRYGNGPLPPAHILCRSHIAPVLNIGDLIEETFYTWVRRQPAPVQDYSLGEEDAVNLRNGKLKSKDLTKFKSAAPLTLNQFRKAIKEILSR
ncbi:hypothetical protein [Pseudomonas phage KP1]|uniref:Head morphogenesis protein n=1 Tax=Pseudomonas phage KP1 TaxID=2562463 RepID=A0A6G5QAX7_9CAUD|nr:head morphogenesis [Pseudomonas phage KP1]QBZ71750.1 hypothetical protein [Pseudomonas phage KP1]